MILKNYFIPFLALSIILAPIPLYADWGSEKKKIDFLITEVSKIDGEFIRNGKSHTPHEAAEHLRMKLNKAINSWFAPSKDKWTAEMFIEKIASKSSLSGKPYLIKFKKGKTIKTRIWLYRKLKDFRGI